MEKNNDFNIGTNDIESLKNIKLSHVYWDVMRREKRTGLPRLYVKAGEHWIIGTVSRSNLGYDFRGQLSTDLHPQITEDMSLYDMLFPNI
ncbi:hypothetical protein V3O24_04410 [Methylobacter sp. Wu8]|uniref:hypothetical protein n=1 Tax=Methylobacter sp. Wu8 TaxID=3118457 RepID=UPI002F335AEB